MDFKNFNSSVGSQSSSKKREEETSPAGNKFSNFHKNFNVETVVKQEKKPVEQVKTPIEPDTYQGRTIDLSIKKTSIFDKAKSFVGKVSSSLGSWYDSYQTNLAEKQLGVSELMRGKATYKTDPVTGKKTLSTEAIEKYKSAQTIEEKNKILDESVQKAPIMKFLNSKVGKSITGTIQEQTSNIPLKAWARIKSIGDDTYDEAKSALLAKKEDPNNNRFERIMFGLQDSGVQSGIGALLSIGASYITRNPRVGQAVSLAYFAPISAESQRKEKGSVKSLTNIGIDTLGDTLISGFAESALKNVIKEGGEVALKEFAKTIGKGFLVEGTTEPTQTLLKYANDYKTARGEDAKKKIVAQVVDYVKSGAMVDEFLIGGLSGAGITAVATGVGKVAGGNNVDVNPSLQPKEPVVGQIDEDFITVRDEVDTLRQDIAQDPENKELSERLAILQDQLDDYQQTVKNRPIYVSDENSDAPIAMIETVQYQDGKFASRISANTPNAGADTNFLDSKLYDTEKEAIDSAKQELTDWVDATRKDTTDPAEIEALDNIMKGITQPEVIGDVPIEVRVNREEVEGVRSVPVSEVESGLGEAIDSKINNDNPKIVSLVEAIKRGDSVPPVPVYVEDGKYILNKDGAHRLRAFKLAGVGTIPVKVEEKTTKTSTQKQTEERAKNEPTLSKGYTRYTITLDNGEKVYADFDMGKGIGEKGGASHVEFKSIIEGESNSISDTGYKSLFSQYNPEGLSEEQIIEDITDVANRLVEEESKTRKKQPKKVVTTKGTKKGSTEPQKAQQPTNEYATTPDQTFYHGTLAQFDTFDLQRAGENTEWDNAKWGFFFIDDKARAEKFIEDTRPTGDSREANIMEVQLDIKNPIDLTIAGIVSKPEQAKTIMEILGSEDGADMTNQEAVEYLDENIDLGSVGELYEALYENIENKKLLQDAGYDGIVSEFGREDGKTILEYVAFDPSQIQIKQKPNKEDAQKTETTKSVLDGIENDIPFDTAQDAYRGTSFEPETRAKSTIKDYVDTMESVYTRLNELANTPEKQSILKERFEKLREGYKSRYIAHLNAKARTISPMISGAGNFPVERNRKRLDMAFKRGDEASDFLNKTTKAIEREINPSKQKIFSGTTPEAIDAIGNELTELKETQRKMKLANKIIQSNTNVEQKLKNELGYSDKIIKEIMTPTFGKKGWPSFALTSINNKIKTLEKKQTLAQKKRERAETTGNSVVNIGENQIVQNFDEDRLQILFKEKPNAEIISKLKSRGFRWSPFNKAWQRKLTLQSAKDANFILTGEIANPFTKKPEIGSTQESPSVEKETVRTLTEEEIKIPEKSRYYVRNSATESTFTVAKGDPIFIEKGLTTFINKAVDGGYVVTELNSGLRIGTSGRTKDEAVQKTKDALNKYRDILPEKLVEGKAEALKIGYPYASYISDKKKIFDSFVEKMPKKVLKTYKTLTLAPTQAKTPSEISEELAGLFGDTPIRSIKTVKETSKGLQYKPLVNSTDIKTILTNSAEFNAKPVFVVDNEKNLVFSGKTDTFKIKATAMGLNVENLAEGDRIDVDIDALKAKGSEKQLRVFKGGSVLASLKSPQGQKTLRKIMERPSDEGARDPQTVPKDFKVSERAKSILKEFNVVSGERTLSNRYLGVYKPLTKKIRVQAFYDVTTVTHEAVHAIDDQIGFAQRIIEDPKGKKRNGVRKQLTDIYTKLYPGGKKTHKLELRIKEGLAVLFENYFYDPVNTTRAYPDLVEKFVKPTGEYYDPLFAKLLDRMNSLVADYAQLSPEDKIASRIRTGKEVVKQEGGFTKAQRATYEIFNRFEPLKRYAKVAGVTETWDDPMIQAFNILNKNSIVFNWVKGKETPILMRDGNFKIEKGTVADYLALTKGSEKQFRSYLIARRVFESNNNATALKNARDLEVSLATPSQTGIEVLMQLRPELTQEQATLLAKAKLREQIYAKYDEQIKKIEDIIRKDDFSVHDAEAVVAKYGRKFAEAERIYDNINKRLITLSEENGLINKETANTYRSEKGYASFRRFIDEELDSVGTITSSSKSKVSSFKERTGSQLDIIDPIYSQILAINEVMGKAMENRLWQKVDGLAKLKPEISQRFEKIDPVIAIDGQGKISYPQEKDPGIIRIWVDGKREFRKASPEFIAVQKTLRGKERDAFVQILRIPSSVFTRLTTSANPFFAVGNLAVGQISATTQSKKGFVPIVDPAKGLVDYIKSDEAIRAYYAIGGKRQTLSAYFDLSPDDVVHRLTGGETKIEKISGIIDSKLGILEMPSNLSEILTRFSEYKRAVKSGEPMSVAMYRASEVSTPFQLQGNFGGRLGQEYIKSIPYLNAIIQVLYKYGRTVKTDPKRVATMSAALLAVALTTAIAVMRDSSDEQKRLLSEQPARNMSRYLYFPSPNGKGLIKLRIPEQMGVFTGLAYLYVIQNYGGNKVSFDNYVDLITSTVPEQINILDPKKMVLSYIPQVLKPSVMVASNTKTFPDVAPIVPQFVSDRKPSEQYNAYTSSVAKTIGQLTNTSPMLIDYWVKNQFGVVGGLLVGKVPSDPVNIQEKDYVMSGRSYNKFYDDRTIVQQQYSVVKETPANYNPEEINEIKQKQKVYTEMSDVLTNMRKINNTIDLPEDVRKMAYDVLLNIDTRSYSENVNFIVPLKNKVDAIRYQNQIK